MSIKSKQKCANIGTILIMTLAFYFLTKKYVPDTLHHLGQSMLVFIGILVAVLIIINVIFYFIYAMALKVKNRKLADEEVKDILDKSTVEDEMDQVINLKSIKVAFGLLLFGFLLFLVLLTLNQSLELALHCQFLFFLLSIIVANVMEIYYYEKGF